MNTIEAKGIKKNESGETQKINTEIHIGVFFDGTNNNANNNDFLDYFKLSYFVSKNHALNNKIGSIEREISNPAILSTLFTQEKTNSNRSKHFIRAYIEGSGTNSFQAKNGVIDFLINGKPVVGLGFGMGNTGVISKVSKAIRIVGNEIKAIAEDSSIMIKSIHFYIFGFSRGATCARLFSYIVARARQTKLPALRETGKDAYDVESAFKKYLLMSLSGLNYQNDRVCFLCGEKWTSIMGKPNISVDFLGIYDTVSAIGKLKHANEIKDGDADSAIMELHYKNAKRFGLYSPSLESVKSTCHICAIDEYRANFALTDIGSASSNASNIELFMPGCHSDIGGGYGTENKKEKAKTLDMIHNGSITMFFKGPIVKSNLSNDYWKTLTPQLLSDLGWIKDEKELLSKDGNKIVFRHAPDLKSFKDIYSNVSLKFMYERAKQRIKDFGIVFTGSLKERDIPEDGFLQDIWKGVREFINQKNGRYFFIPDEETYYKLRVNYLHFTATDKLININSVGDIGNEPAKISMIIGNKQYRYITRYVYRGGQKDDIKVHYMNEYEK